MDKLLFVGGKDKTAALVRAYLFNINKYEICSCEPHEINRTIKIQKPKVLLHFKNMTDDTNIYAEIKNDFPKLGIVVVCEQGDDSLAENHLPGVEVLKRPLIVSKIYETIVKMCEQPKSEEMIKKKKKILAIDDSIMVLRNIKYLLEKEYDIAVANSGQKALEMLSSEKYDIILLDYEMPVMSGREIIKRIRNMPEIKDIPVVFLTGVADKSKICDVIIYNPAGYLLKPLDSEEIIKTIQKILG